MRDMVRHYNGYEITNDVIRKINLIKLRCIDERTVNIPIDHTNTLKKLCLSHHSLPNEEYIILGEDWYISYAVIERCVNQVQINEWVSLKNISNKFIQTMEMVNSFKEILIGNQDKKISAYMRHLTSYQFYQKLLELGYLEEIYDYPILHHTVNSSTREIVDEILKRYGSILKYLKDGNREFLKIEQSTYHDINFSVTEKFVRKYRKLK